MGTNVQCIHAYLNPFVQANNIFVQISEIQICEMHRKIYDREFYEYH